MDWDKGGRRLCLLMDRGEERGVIKQATYLHEGEEEMEEKEEMEENEDMEEVQDGDKVDDGMKEWASIVLLAAVIIFGQMWTRPPNGGRKWRHVEC